MGQHGKKKLYHYIQNTGTVGAVDSPSAPGRVAGGEGSSAKRPCMAWYTASLTSSESVKPLMLPLPDTSFPLSKLRSPSQAAV